MAGGVGPGRVGERAGRGGFEGVWEESAGFWHHLRVITNSQLNQ